MTTARPIITLVLRPEPNVDVVPALRALLKGAMRCYGLRAVRIEITPPGDQQPGITPLPSAAH